MSLVYTVHETRNKIREIQTNAKSGLVSELVNKSTQESMFMLSSKMFEGIVQLIQKQNIIEFDQDLKIYTIYNDLVPQLVGEGQTQEAAIDQLVEEAIQFAQDYLEHAEVLSGIFTGIQQLLISTIILSEGNKTRVREVLGVA